MPFGVHSFEINEIQVAEAAAVGLMLIGVSERRGAIGITSALASTRTVARFQNLPLARLSWFVSLPTTHKLMMYLRAWQVLFSSCFSRCS